jgi:hypothetical protein
MYIIIIMLECEKEVIKISFECESVCLATIFEEKQLTFYLQEREPDQNFCPKYICALNTDGSELKKLKTDSDL